MFIFKRLHPQGGDPAPAPPRSCKSETLRRGCGAQQNRIKAASPRTSARTANLIHCYKLLHSDVLDIWYNLPPRTKKSGPKPKNYSSCQSDTPRTFSDTMGMNSCCFFFYSALAAYGKLCYKSPQPPNPPETSVKPFITLQLSYLPWLLLSCKTGLKSLVMAVSLALAISFRSSVPSAHHTSEKTGTSVDLLSCRNSLKNVS